MEYRGKNYSVVQSLEGKWKWTIDFDGHSRSHQNLEVIMTLGRISLASAAAITIISWGAWAQENQNKGRITQLDHINGTITLQHAPAESVGAVGASSLVDEYKIQDGVASKDLHAGDEVDFTAARIGGVLTITKIQKK